LTTGAAWFLPLRTDSVNRDFCISLFTSEMIFRAISSRFFFFIFIKINTDGAQNLFSMAHKVAPTEDGQSGICWTRSRDRPHFRHNQHLQQRGTLANASRDGDEGL